MTCENCGNESHCEGPLLNKLDNPYDRIDIRHNPPIICQSCRCEKCDSYWEVRNKHDDILLTCRSSEDAYNRANQLADEHGEPFSVISYRSKEYWKMKNEMASTINRS